jgi:hypothetical protein
MLLAWILPEDTNATAQISDGEMTGKITRKMFERTCEKDDPEKISGSKRPARPTLTDRTLTQVSEGRLPARQGVLTDFGTA